MASIAPADSSAQSDAVRVITLFRPHTSRLVQEIKIIHESPWITIFCHEWGDSATIFTSDEKLFLNRIMSDKKSFFMVTNVLFYFLLAILYPEHTILLKTIIDHWFRYWSFLTWHCDVTTIYLWFHMKVVYWHGDVIFVNCSCTCILAQRQSLPVNNHCEYQFLATQYSWLSM